MPIHIPPISRRRFLAGSLAAGAGCLFSPLLPASEVAVDPNRWALLADIHIWQQRHGVHGGVKPADNLAQAVAEIVALRPRPAGMIVAGDCAFHEGRAADYAVLADLVRPIREAGIHIHFVLGNHDHRKTFWAAFPDVKPRPAAVPDKHTAIVETPRARWLLLDSLHKTNDSPGWLGKPQLDWLAKTLDARPDRPALVVAHHNPDYLHLFKGLQDVGELVGVMAPRNQAKAYVFGHSHAWSLFADQQIHMVNLPAVAWLFDKAQVRGWIDCRLLPRGAALTMQALDKKDRRHGRQVELAWRVADDA
ncbi:MAG: metallophosphoesterase [Thermoguttaceae bacterium]|jgi:hypothetical protein